MKRICVFAGSNAGVRDEYRAAAEQLGRTLVERGIALVYGGARVGLMGVLADTVLAGRGDVTGVMPEALVAKEVAHNGLADLRVVGSMHERKALMAELADGFIALPGGWGTWEEFFEVLTWAQLGLHDKPCALLNIAGYFTPMLAAVEHSIAEGFVKQESRPMVITAASSGELIDRMLAYEPPRVTKWITERAT